MARIVRHPFIGLVVLLALLALFGCQSQQAPVAKPAATSATSAPSAPTQAPAPQPTAAPPAAATAAPQTAATAVPQAAAPETLKVGLPMPVTGANPRMGMIAERFLRMSIDDINAKGGVKVGGKVYKMEGVTADTKFTSEGGREAANKLVLSDKVKFLLGGFNPDTAGAQAITEPNKVLTIAFGAIFKSLGPDFPLTFEAGVANQLIRLNGPYDWLQKDRPTLKRIATLLSDDATGKNYSESVKPVLQQRGLTLIAQEWYPLDIKDFAPVATRLLRQNPEVIDIGATGALAQVTVNLANAFREQGYKGLFLGTAIYAHNAVPALEGYVGAGLGDRESSMLTPAEKDVIQRYIQKYGVADFEPVGYPVYNVPLILSQAMESAGTVDDAVKLASVLRQNGWNTIFGGQKRFVGKKTFGLEASLEQPVYMSTIQGGKIVSFSRVDGTLP